MGNLRVDATELTATHASWTAKAATFARVAAPPQVTAMSASATAVAAIHAQVAEGHTMFGQRLSETAAHIQRAAVKYVSADDGNASALGEAAP